MLVWKWSIRYFDIFYTWQRVIICKWKRIRAKNTKSAPWHSRWYGFSLLDTEIKSQRLFGYFSGDSRVEKFFIMSNTLKHLKFWLRTTWFCVLDETFFNRHECNWFESKNKYQKWPFFVCGVLFGLWKTEGINIWSFIIRFVFLYWSIYYHHYLKVLWDLNYLGEIIIHFSFPYIIWYTFRYEYKIPTEIEEKLWFHVSVKWC